MKIYSVSIKDKVDVNLHERICGIAIDFRDACREVLIVAQEEGIENPEIFDLDCLGNVKFGLKGENNKADKSNFREELNNCLPISLPNSYEGMKSLCATLTDKLHKACDIIENV